MCKWIRGFNQVKVTQHEDLMKKVTMLEEEPTLGDKLKKNLGPPICTTFDAGH